jgi:hypothetical protein
MEDTEMNKSTPEMQKTLHHIALEIIDGARLQIDKDTTGSAQLCYNDALTCIIHNEPMYAINKALTSLRYSVGIFSDFYKIHLLAAKEALGELAK